MQEERYPTAGNPMPFNMLLGKGYPREVFDEFIDPFEAPQARLKQPIPSNETVCLPKDEVARTCPQLLPPAPTMQPYGFCGAPLKNQAIGDGYIINYAEKPIGGSIFDDRRRTIAPRAWYFPAAPSTAMLRPVPRGSLTRVGRGPALKVSMFPQMGGAVGGITWRGRQLLALRPGRPQFNRQSALQVQVATNIPPGGHDRQRRANEAGGWWNRANSSSKLLGTQRGFNARRGRDVAFTRTQASYFHRPGRTVYKRRVLNTTELSPYQVTKRIGVGPDYFKLRTGVNVPAMERVTSMRIAAARFALVPSMNRVMAFHAATRRWVSLKRSRTLNVGVYTAIAITNARGDVAMGVTLTNFPKPPYGTNFRPAAYYAVNATNRPAGTLVAVVHKLGIRGAQTALPGNKTYSYHMHFQFGTLAQVTRKLSIIANNLNRASQFLIIRKGWTPQRLRYACAPQRVVTRTVYVNAQGQPIRGGGYGGGGGRGYYPPMRLPRPPMSIGNAWGPRPGMTGMWMQVRNPGQMEAEWVRQRNWMRMLREQGWIRDGKKWVPPKKAAVKGKAKVCRVKADKKCKKCKLNDKSKRCKGCTVCGTETPKPKWDAKKEKQERKKWEQAQKKKNKKFKWDKKAEKEWKAASSGGGGGAAETKPPTTWADDAAKGKSRCLTNTAANKTCTSIAGKSPQDNLGRPDARQWKCDYSSGGGWDRRRCTAQATFKGKTMEGTTTGVCKPPKPYYWNGKCNKGRSPTDVIAAGKASGKITEVNLGAPVTNTSCYGAKDGECKTCYDVVAAYEAKKWTYNKSDFDQCKVY